MTGKDVAYIVLQVGDLKIGRGWFVNYDLDRELEKNSRFSETSFQKRTDDEIQRRMKRTYEALARFVTVGLQSGIVSASSQGGMSIRSRQEMNREEEKALRKVQEELGRVDKTINL